MKRTLLALVSGTLIVTLAGGCSLVAKRTADETWSVGILNVRGFDDSDEKNAKYIFAIYDGTAPAENSLGLLQLWSGRRKAPPAGN